MAQHVPAETWKNEPWYKELMHDVDTVLGTDGEYYSLYDNQTGEYLHSGRNSKNPKDCVMEAFDFFEDAIICPCGNEMYEYEQVCDDCGYKVSEYIDKTLKYAEAEPEHYVSEHECVLIKHEVPIPEDDERLQSLPDEYAWNGGQAYMFHTDMINQLDNENEMLTLKDCGIEIHINRDIEPKKQVYIVI